MKILEVEKGYVHASQFTWNEESKIKVYSVDDDELFFPAHEGGSVSNYCILYLYREGDKHGKGWYKYGVKVYPYKSHVENIAAIDKAYEKFKRILALIDKYGLLAWRQKRKHAFDPDGGDLGLPDDE